MKKKYNIHTGGYEYYDRLTGSGVMDIFSNIGSKLASDSIKKALETAGKQALETGSKKLGDELGKYVVNKAMGNKTIHKPMGNIIVKELSTPKNTDIEINKLLSGSGSKNKYSDRINKLLK